MVLRWVCISAYLAEIVMPGPAAEWVEELGRFNNWTLSPLEFKARYRLPKDAVAALSEDFLASGFCSTNGRVAKKRVLGYDERVLAMLRYMSTGADFKSTGDAQVKLSKTTVSRCLWEVVDFIYFNQERYIRWPQTPEEQHECAQLFDIAKYGHKPLCVGAADCTQIGIKTPNKNRWQEEAFVNRKSYHSINTLLVVDAKQRILHCDARWPGSASDAYIFNCSEIRDFGDRGLFNNYFLIADSGFRLRKYCLTPFVGTVQNLTRPQQEYNAWHASARSVVEMTNGQVKQRFRVLDSLSGDIDHEPDKVTKLITVACCLHNLSKSWNDPMPPDDPDATNQHAVHAPQPAHHVVVNNIRANINYRQQYVDTYFP